MSEEEIIEDYINFIKVFAKKEQIENVNHLTFRGRRKEQLKILKNFLDLYQKEKEKNKKSEEKLDIEKYANRQKSVKIFKFEKDYISKDKIKAKIEELEKTKLITDEYGKAILRMKIKLLQELLEE